MALVRGTAAWVFCALVLTGCENLNELKEKIWPFDSPQAGEQGAAASDGGDVPVTAETGEEVALDPALVAEVQKKLTELGYEPGPLDGVMGPKTREAVRRYQMVEGLPVDGRVTQPLLVRLTGSAAALEPSPVDGTSRAGEAPAVGIAFGPAPVYEAGSRYVYADGEVRTVLSVERDQVYWQSSNDGHSVEHSNFLIPSLSWVSSETSGKRALTAGAGDLWPGESGKEIAFSTTAEVVHKARPNGGAQLNETWRCRVGDGGRLTVSAGEFQTRKISCDGLTESGEVSRQRVWHYAPEIGHYVLYEESGGSQQGARRSELLAIVPNTVDWPPVARAGLGWALEHALETAAPGERSTWTSSAVDIEVTIEPGEKVAMGDNETCRKFVQVWTQPGGERIYPGLSCREPSGQWLIPGLEAGVALAKGAE